MRVQHVLMSWSGHGLFAIEVALARDAPPRVERVIGCVEPSDVVTAIGVESLP